MGLMKNGFCSIVVFLVVANSLNSMAADIDLSCGSSMSRQCGESIGRKVTSSKGPPPTDECCAQLVKIGKPCHDAYTREHLKIRDFKGRTYVLLERSERVWNNCAEIVKFVFPAPTGAPKSRN